jgi:protein-tyrosine phosphatase
MIDIHSHILPGLDDGAANMDEAVAIARGALASGIKQIVATPHVRTRRYPSKETILDATSNLQKELQKKGINFPVLPGGEYRIDPELPQRFSKGELLTINDKGRYLLVELPDAYVPDYTAAVLNDLQAQGVTPIIAHPERNDDFIRDHSRLYELVAHGALAQLTAGSLTGFYYPEITVAARAFLEQGLIHFLGSDAHSASGQLPHFKPGARETMRVLGEEQGHRVLKINPQRVVRGEFIEVGELKKKAT